jgi:hypothetical protein
VQQWLQARSAARTGSDRHQCRRGERAGVPRGSGSPTPRSTLSPPPGLEATPITAGVARWLLGTVLIAVAATLAVAVVTPSPDPPAGSVP